MRKRWRETKRQTVGETHIDRKKCAEIQRGGGGRKTNGFERKKGRYTFQTDRQTDRLTDRQADKQTSRQADKQTSRQTDI